MSLEDTIKHRAAKVLSERKEYYAFGDVFVYIKDPLPQDIDMTMVIKQVEETVPTGLTQELEGIYVGQFPELKEREISAIYKDATIYMTNEQSSVEDMVDDIVHEIAHSVESFAGMEIYSDGYLEKEFIEKRKILLDILYREGYNIEVVRFLDVEYSREMDYFLYKGVGYDKLALLIVDIFPTPYSVTCLREYFAVGIEEYLYGDRQLIKNICPVLYSKIENIMQLCS